MKREGEMRVKRGGEWAWEVKVRGHRIGVAQVCIMFDFVYFCGEGGKFVRIRKWLWKDMSSANEFV